MDLRTYLHDHDVPVTVLASQAAVSVQAIHRYLSGERMPRPEVIERIKEATGGKVTANDFVARISEARAAQAATAEREQDAA